MENDHDYIQWLFPLTEPRQYSSLAPILDAEQIAKFHKDAELRANLLAAFDIMLGFYGFERNNMSIIQSNTWEERNPNWLRTGNHNHLRLTRILKSLSVLGLKDSAYALFEVLNAIFAEKSNVISDTTMEYWKHTLLET